MARTRTTAQADAQEQQADGPVDTGFGAEFRELARQRRFVRSGDEPASKPAAAQQPKASPRVEWRSAAAAAAAASPQQPASVAAPRPAPAAAPKSIVAPRLSDDQRAIVRELARMSDQLVDAREQLAAATARAAHLDAELAASRAQVRAAEDRVLASHLLVQDAQRATHELAERCAALEARCDTLQQALELAVNASWVTRWRWRREQRARARS